MDQALKRKTYGNGRMNRSDILEFTPAETALYKAMQEVEKIGAHPDLTNVVTKLNSTLDDLQDYIEKNQFVNEGENNGL